MSTPLIKLTKEKNPLKNKASNLPLFKPNNSLTQKIKNYSIFEFIFPIFWEFIILLVRSYLESENWPVEIIEWITFILQKLPSIFGTLFKLYRKVQATHQSKNPLITSLKYCTTTKINVFLVVDY